MQAPSILGNLLTPLLQVESTTRQLLAKSLLSTVDADTLLRQAITLVLLVGRNLMRNP